VDSSAPVTPSLASRTANHDLDDLGDLSDDASDSDSDDDSEDEAASGDD
jgi:hypothetical protein